MRYVVPIKAITGLAFTFETESMPLASRQFALGYGLKQWLNDGHASVTSDTHPIASERVAAKRKLVDERYAKLVSGIGLPNMDFDPIMADPAVMAFIEARRAELAEAAKAATEPTVETTPVKKSATK